MSAVQTLTIAVGGMSCVRCAAAVERALRQLDGVQEATVSFANGKAQVTFDSSVLTRKKLEKAVRAAGYTVIEDAAVYKRRAHRKAVALFVFAAVFSLPFAVMMVLMFTVPHARLTHILHNGWLQFALATPVQVLAGWQFYKAAAASLRNRSPGMDLLVAMGTTAAWGYSTYAVFAGESHFYFEGAAMVITLILLGRLLETRAREKTSAAIEKLLQLRPETAVVRRGDAWVSVPAAQVQSGDRLLVKAGEHLPTDGVVAAGSSHVDESMLTGESMPIAKQIGDTVTGGTINGDDVLEITATAVGEKTVLAGIIRLVENAQSSKAPIQRLADKIAAVFVPIVAAVALLTLCIWLLIGEQPAVAIEHAVAVLVIACPCSLGLATPTALMVGMGRGANMGILLKNADALENACRLQTILLDKTGTITAGKPSVTSIYAADDFSETDILQMAASVEAYATHPLAKAVCDSFDGALLPVENFANTIGNGVGGTVNGNGVKIGTAAFAGVQDSDAVRQWSDARRSEGQTVLFVSVDGAFAAALAVADPIREESAAAVRDLHALGIETVMLTGDKPATAHAIAQKAGVDTVIAEVLPHQKAEQVRRLCAQNGAVGMAGDGVNDAPALAQATVGFAMGSGTDIAMEAGDVVLVGGGIAALPRAVRLSRATMRKIRQNLFWAFFYNTVGIPLAACGLLSPVLAGAAMAFSSVSVVTNSLLLRKSKL